MADYTFALTERKLRNSIFRNCMLTFKSLLLGKLFSQRSLALVCLFLLSTAGAYPIPPNVKGDVVLSDPLTVRWRYESSITLNLTPAADNDRIYLPLAGGVIVALNAKDGQLLWRSEIGGELSASPIADDSAIYVASEIVNKDGQQSRSSGVIRAVGREGGVTQWVTPLVQPLRGGITISGGRLFAGGSDGRAYAFDKKTGGVFWSIPFNSSFSGHPVADGGRVYFGSEDGTLLALEASTGKQLWRYRTKGVVKGPVAVAGGQVYFGSGDGYVYAVDVEKGRLSWRKRTGGRVEAVVLSGESLLVASLDNFAYLLSLKGSMHWKRLLPGRISALPLAMQESALFTPLSSSTAVVLALKDGKQVNALPAGEEMTSSAAPIVVGDAVFLTTEHGLVAFARPPESSTKRKP